MSVIRIKINKNIHGYIHAMAKSDIHTWIYPWIYPWISISTATLVISTDFYFCFVKKVKVKVKVKEHIVLREIHLRTTGRHLSMGSHSVICYPTEVTAPPSPQPGRLVLDLSTP